MFDIDNYLKIDAFELICYLKFQSIGPHRLSRSCPHFDISAVKPFRFSEHRLLAIFPIPDLWAIDFFSAPEHL